MGHASHSESPTCGAILPVGHSVHSGVPVSDCVAHERPMGQSLHGHGVSLALENVPEGHTMQLAAPAADALPAAQTEHVVARALGWARPAVHGSHVDVLSLFVKLPAEQASHPIQVSQSVS